MTLLGKGPDQELTYVISSLVNAIPVVAVSDWDLLREGLVRIDPEEGHLTKGRQTIQGRLITAIKMYEP